MKKMFFITVFFVLALTVMVGCGTFEGREYNAKVVEFNVKESNSGYSIVSVDAETPDGIMTIKLKNVDYESMNAEATRITSISSGKATTTLTVRKLELLFEDGEQFDLEIDGDVNIKEIRKNVWTISQ